MRLNPIVKKDIKVQSRSMRMSWGVFSYELILALVFFLSMLIIRNRNMHSIDNIYSAMVWLYPVLAVTQFVILGIVTPVRTASSISGEKERQTFDIMMTTSMSPFSVIIGKVMTATVQSMFYVIASMPVMALCFVIGGMSWSYLFWFLAISLLISLFSASIGILCSSLCRKSISAVIMSYGFYLIFFVATALPGILYTTTPRYRAYQYGTTAVPGSDPLQNLFLFLLVNPAVYLTEFFSQIMAGESVVNGFSDNIGVGQQKGLIHSVASGNTWMILSTVLFLGISFLFLWLAARRINPARKAFRKRK